MKQPAFSACITAGILGVVFLVQTNGHAQKAKTKPAKSPPGQVIIAGNGMLFVPTPKGWLPDTAGRETGVNAAFVRAGETWAKGSAVMYVRVLPRDGRSLSRVVQDDIADFQKHSPDMEVTPDKTFLNNRKGAVEVYVFSHVNERTSKERVAYVATPSYFLLVVLSAYTESAYQNSLNAHAALVQSLLITSPIIVDPKKKAADKPST